MFGQMKEEVGTVAGVFSDLARDLRHRHERHGRRFLSRSCKSCRTWAQSFMQPVREVWIDIKISFEQMVVAMKGDLADFLDQMAKATDKFSGAGWVSNLFGGPSAQKSMAEFTKGLRDVDDGLKGYEAEMDAANAKRDESLASNAAWASSVRLSASSLTVMTTGLQEISRAASSRVMSRATSSSSWATLKRTSIPPRRK